MINVSSDYKTAIENSENWVEEITFALADGSTLVAKNANIWQGGLALEDTVAESGSLWIGSTHINQATITLWNGELSAIEDVDFNLDSNGHLIMNGNAVTYQAVYDNVDFTEADVTVKVGLPGFDLIQKGEYVVSDFTKDDGVINIVAYDYMHKLSRTFDSSIDADLTFPCTLGDIADWVCVNNGVTLITPTFNHYDLQISAIPDGFTSLTYREIIGYVAMIAGTYARFDRFGRLAIGPTDASQAHGIGGMFNHHEGELVHPTGVKLNQHYTYETQTVLDDGTVDVESEERDVALYAGTDGYIISLDYNPLIEMGQAQTICNWIYNIWRHQIFYIYDLTKMNDPTIEAGDVAVVYDAKGQQRRILISHVTFGTGSEQTIESNAPRPSQTKIERPSNYLQGIEELKAQLARQQELRHNTSASIASSAEDAKKVANNYISADSTGMMVADMQDGQQTPSTATGKNVKISNTEVSVRDGQTVVASFSGNSIQLGNNTNTKITLDTTNGLKLGENVSVDMQGNASFKGSGNFDTGFLVNVPHAFRQDMPTEDVRAVIANNSTYGLGMSAETAGGLIYSCFRANIINAYIYGKQEVQIMSGGNTTIHAEGNVLFGGNGTVTIGGHTVTINGFQLRHDVPASATFDDATTSARGYMTATDKTRLNALYNMCKKAGNVWTAGNVNTGGYITNGSKDIHFVVPLPPIYSGTLEVTSLSMRVRQNNGYIFGTSAPEAVAVSQITLSSQAGYAEIHISFASALSGATNNEPVGIQATIAFALT